MMIKPETSMFEEEAQCYVVRTGSTWRVVPVDFQGKEQGSYFKSSFDEVAEFLNRRREYIKKSDAWQEVIRSRRHETADAL